MCLSGVQTSVRSTLVQVVACCRVASVTWAGTILSKAMVPTGFNELSMNTYFVKDHQASI